TRSRAGAGNVHVTGLPGVYIEHDASEFLLRAPRSLHFTPPPSSLRTWTLLAPGILNSASGFKSCGKENDKGSGLAPLSPVQRKSANDLTSLGGPATRKYLVPTSSRLRMPRASSRSSSIGLPSSALAPAITAAGLLRGTISALPLRIGL